MSKYIWAALNQCDLTGLEVQVATMETLDGKHIRLFRDHKGWYRIVLFATSAPDSGISAVVVEATGEIHFKHTARHHRGHNYTRNLQAVLTLCGVSWYKSELLTDAGAACYKNN